MKGLKAWILIAYLLAIVLVPTDLVYSADSPNNQESTALFGTVSEIQLHGIGQANILLDTVEGNVSLSVSRATPLNMPGREHVSLEQIVVGDFLAVVVQPGNKLFKVLQLLVKPTIPITVKHLTGVVVAQEARDLTLIDSQGNSLLLELAEGLKAPSPGTTVTLIIKYDFQTDAIIVSGIANANNAIDRLHTAIDKAIGSEDTPLTDILKQRLDNAINSHLTMLQNTLSHTSSRPSSYPSESILQIEQSLINNNSLSKKLFSRFNLGNPMIKIAGVITLVDLFDIQSGNLTITPPNEDPLDVSFTKDTNITFRGEEIQLSAQNLGNLVTILYDTNTRETSAIKLEVPSIRKQSLESLLKDAFRDELEGTVAAITLDVTPPLVAIVTKQGGLVFLKTLTDSTVIVGGQSVPLSQLRVNSEVKILLDPLTNNILEIRTFKVGSGEQALSGVVNTIIGKQKTITVATSNGIMKQVKITEDTVINRNGKTVSIGQIRLGDVVRPTTLIQQNTGNLIWLSLKALGPLPVTGNIRGITLSDHGKQLTLLSTTGDVLSLNLTDSTILKYNSNTILFEDLQIGDRVSGQYDPITMDVPQLAKQPTRVRNIKGILRSKDAFLFTISVQATEGDPIIMAITGGTEIIQNGIIRSTFHDIQAGDTIDQAFYDTKTLTATRLIVTSRK